MQGSAPIQQIFEKYLHASQVIELKDFPFLEVFVTDIFIGKSSKLLET
ncbi:MAG: hypothetical protein ACFFDB_05015 [Promethearchaeota archaeon]